VCLDAAGRVTESVVRDADRLRWLLWMGPRFTSQRRGTELIARKAEGLSVHHTVRSLAPGISPTPTFTVSTQPNPNPVRQARWPALPALLVPALTLILLLSGCVGLAQSQHSSVVITVNPKRPGSGFASFRQRVRSS
jgi:hypothetical protein